MKKIATTLALLAVCSLAATTAFASNSVRISQLYGGGGNSGAPYSNDYIELFNFSGSPVDISGWSLQYQSATGTGDQGTCVNCLTTFPSGSVIPSCGYFLVQLAAGATPSGALPVTPDLVIPQVTANNLSATAGKIGLKNNALTGPCLPINGWVDFIGYGAAATCSEGSAAGGLSNSSGAVRGLGGVTDSDNNNLDFAVVSTPIPHNTQSPKNTECLAVPTTPQTWGAIKGIYR